MRGAPLLVALGVLFFAGFALQRARSPFLQIEQQAGLAREVGARAGLTVAEVMALRELCGADLDSDRVLEIATMFAADRARGGEELAVLRAVGRGGLADELERLADGDRARVHELLRPRPEAVHPARFAAMRERFAARAR